MATLEPDGMESSVMNLTAPVVGSIALHGTRGLSARMMS
jgi:hypothetical protein